MGIIIAFLWGFGEASFFFIVPDVWISWIVLRTKNPKNEFKNSFKKGTQVAFVTLLGALLGGSIMFYFGNKYPETTSNFLQKIPAIRQDMLEIAKESISNRQYLKTIIAPFVGKPYKIYATYHGMYNTNILLFLLISTLARLPRFIIVVSISSIVRKILSNTSRKQILSYFLIFWISFYIFYFWIMT